MAAVRKAAFFALLTLALAGEPEIRLPSASEAGKPAEGAAVVNLTSDGLVLMDKEGKPERLSLDLLAERLRARKAKVVAIRADERAPWLQVQRLLEICAEVERVEFGVKGAGGEEGWIPARPPAGAPKGDAAKVTVRMLVTREEPGIYGPTQTAIGVPTEVTYRIGEVEAKDIAPVRRFIRDAGQTAAQGGDPIEGTIAPATRIPWGKVAELLNEFRRAGIPHIRLAHADPALTPEERRLNRLPYPAK